MQALTETRAPCHGADMEPYGPTQLQRSADARHLITTFCHQCPAPLITECLAMRDGAPGIWGGLHFPDRVHR